MSKSGKRGTAAEFASITPLVPAGPSLDDALTLYVGAMGFRLVWRHVGMAGIERDGVAFNLQQNADRHWAENSSYSIGVHDLPTLHAEFANVPARIGPLEEKPWGRVEFHMVLPSGVCLQFYEAEEPPIGTVRVRSTD